MSITSPVPQINSDFSVLLENYPGLKEWLAEIIEHQDERQAENILPSFLTECASLNVPGNVYPFTSNDWGLVDLRTYLHCAQIEIEAITTRLTHQSPVFSAAGEALSSTQEREASSPALPVVEKSEANDTRESPAPKEETDSGSLNGLAGEEENKQGEKSTNHKTENCQEDNEQDIVAPEEKETANGLSILAVEAASQVASEQANVPGVPGTGEVSEQAVTPIEASELAANSQPMGPTLEDESKTGEPEAKPLNIDTDPVEEAKEVEVTKKSVAIKSEGNGKKPIKILDLLKRRHKHGSGLKVRRRWTRRQRIVAAILTLVILGTILVPAGALVNFGVSAYTTYHTLSDEAHDAVNHLLNVKKILTGGQSSVSSALNTTKLQQARQEFVASGQDFQTLQNELKHSSTLNTVMTYFPSYRSTIQSVQAASAIGIDIAQIGQIATTSGMQIAPALSGSLLASSGKPLVTQAMLNTIGSTLEQVLPLLNDIQAHTQNLTLSSLPITAQEKAQIEPLLQQLPQIISDMGVAYNLLGAAGWLLGVDQTRTFLVQTMDETELRGAGGFTGQYGELKISGGRIGTFSLKDISSIEYVPDSANQGQLAPEQYRTWWPFANWGLRDSNISADFPTTAQLAINLYKQEVGDQVDGVISFTPVLIEHILAVIGPIHVPGYNVTVNSQNLEDILHYYQLDNAGIGQQRVYQPGDGSTSTRKRFTNNLATLFLQKVRSLQPAELLAVAHQVFADLKTRDLQVYFANPAAESVLMQYGYAGQVDRSTTHDGLFVVQQNLSASKASQYVQTSFHDTVTLDNAGGATHLLQLRLVYNQAGPVYGYDTYEDYVRVYVPPNSQFISGDGFATGTPLCGGVYGDCPVNGVYPGGELICPAGQYQPGAMAPTLTDPSGARWEPLQTIGGPTNTISDESGRAMYAGWVIVPKNCTMNVTLSWYVPPLSQKPYSLLVQRQAGTFPELDLTIVPNAADCAGLHTTGLHFNSILTQDTSFTIPTSQSTGSKGQSCYPQPGV